MNRVLLIILSLVNAFVSTGQSASYFQQRVDFRINVELDDINHQLHAFEQVNYVNHSPDTLTFLVFHLWPNAYENKKTAMARQLIRMGNDVMHFASKKDFGFIDSLDFKVDGKNVEWFVDPTHIDICTLNLAQPILPGDSIKIETPFRVKLPSGDISRLGHGGQAYYITQWFPKPAVYDANGWNGMPYLTQGEFYSEFGAFEVAITLPENYTVGATGDLQNQEERTRMLELVEQTEKWIQARDSNLDWNMVEKDMEFPPSAERTKTLVYKQKNVHDFAWFADKRFHVLRGNVKLPHGNDSVELWTLFTNKNAKVWRESIEFMRDGIYYYSLWNGDYPYRQATAVDGTISAGAGMEYPNVTVIGTAQSPYLLEQVIVHEIGHNWFYGILGSNEREHPWMDEGVNSYYELRYFNTKYPKGAMLFGDHEPPSILESRGLSDYRVGDLHYFSYLYAARQNSDQPMNLPSDEYALLNYGTVVYSKSAVVFDHLRHYLGDSLMDACMQSYFETYKYKHPQPEDLKRIFETVTSLSLDWFFDEMLGATSKYDYQIKQAKSKQGETFVRLKNKGGVQAPVHVAFFEKDALAEELWVPSFKGDTAFFLPRPFDKVVVDPLWRMPEVKRDNNIARTSGVFRKIEPLELSFLGKLENPRKNQLHWLPIFGLTVPGGFMPGIVVYNSIAPVKKLNYAFAPMLSFGQVTGYGMGEVYYMIKPRSSWFETIDLGLRAKRFAKQPGITTADATFIRTEPYVRFALRPPRYNGLFEHELELSAIIVHEDSIVEVGGNAIRPPARTDLYNRFSYIAKIHHPAYPTNFELRVERHTAFLRSSLQVKNEWRITKKLSLYNRLFAGGFFYANNQRIEHYWQLSGQNAANDFAYDATFLDRSRTNPTLSRQFSVIDAAIKYPTTRISERVLAYNGQINFKRIPLGVFGDVVYEFQFTNSILADAGLCLSLFGNFFNVYMPLVYTNNLRNEGSLRDLQWSDLIRFQLNLDKFNPIRLRRNLNLT